MKWHRFGNFTWKIQNGGHKRRSGRRTWPQNSKRLDLKSRSTVGIDGLAANPGCQIPTTSLEWFGGRILAADPNRRIGARKPHFKTAVTNGDLAADHGRRFLESFWNQISGHIMATVHTAKFPNKGKPKEKPRHSPKAVLTLNQAH